ncbi:hypothetical protein [Bradyrhizobium sp. AZCC 1578]|uniref:hypothetical protein n=1 Tax=Bradyrhizobium sp. AZCC 1578 TaxID=3117027 RepID=UPI002FEE6D11
MHRCANERRPKVIGVDGVSDFNALHSGKHNEKVQLCAFDVLALDATIIWMRFRASVPYRAGLGQPRTAGRALTEAVDLFRYG